MGCMFTKAELDNSNPRMFHVWNVDDLGRHVNPGKMEVTEADLILRQKGKAPIHWPLRSLRRYGFDAELFSFESGRRCPTGPGIYAFKCRRAETLFNVLQECIQNSGGGGGGGAGVIVSPSGLDDSHNATTPMNITSNGIIANSNTNNQTPAVDSDGYLEPIVNGSSNCPVVASSSQICNSSLNEVVNIRSNNSAAETNTCTQTDCCVCNQNTNISYANETVFSKATSTGNISANHETCHQYVNSSVINKNSQKCNHNSLIKRGNVTNGNAPICTSISDSVFPSTQLPCPQDNCCLQCMSCVDLNTNYAKLDDLLKQEQSVKQHFYVNVKPDESNNITVNKNITTANCQIIKSTTVTSPNGAQLKAPVVHFYSNLNSPCPAGEPDVADEISEMQQVNYIVLDLDHSSDNKEQVMSPFSSTSITFSSDSHRMPEGYVTIDFDKTAALSNSSNPYLCHDDSVRKTRHNGTISLS